MLPKLLCFYVCGVDNRSRPTRLPSCLHCKHVTCAGSRHSGGKGTGPEDALGGDVQSNVSPSEKVFLLIDGGGSFIPHQTVNFWVDGESGFTHYRRCAGDVKMLDLTTFTMKMSPCDGPFTVTTLVRFMFTYRTTLLRHLYTKKG
jgi:hypothetical protein